MPPLIAAGAAVWGAATAAAGFIGGAIAATWGAIGSIPLIGGAIQGSIASYALGAAAEALGLYDVEQQSTSYDAHLKVNNTSNTHAIPVIYGRRRIGGSEWRAVGGSDNKYLYRVCILSEGEIEGVEKIYLNDKDVLKKPYKDNVETEVRRGEDNQATSSLMDTDNVDGWGSSHIGHKLAYIVARLEFDQDIFTSGLPTLTADVKGRKIYDPRLDSTVTGGSGSHRQDNNSTWEWSENPVLCILDFLTNDIYGRNVPYADIDLASFMTEADYCDETVTLKNSDGQNYTTKRYTCNGAVNVTQDSLQTLRRLLSSCRGALVHSSGFKIKIDKPELSVKTFNEDNILGEWNISGAGTRTRRNKITTRFFDKQNKYEEAIATTTSSQFLETDNNRVLEATVFFPFTNEYQRAEILSQHLLKQSRLNWNVSFTTTLEGIGIEAMDVIKITHSSPGWDQKPFRVRQVTFESQDVVRIDCEEYDDSIYTFDLLTPPSAPQSNLPDPNDARPPSNLSLNSDDFLIAKDGSITERIDAEWDAPPSAYVSEYEVAWKPASEDNWTSIKTRETNFYCAPVTSRRGGRSYQVRVRALYNIAGASEWIPSSAGKFHNVLGKNRAPGRPSEFSHTEGVNYSRVFKWKPPTDPDIAGYIIKYAPVGSLDDQAQWSSMTKLNDGLITQSPYESNLLSVGYYVFAIKAVDTSGNESSQARFINVFLQDSPTVNALETFSPRFDVGGWAGNGGAASSTQILVPTNLAFTKPLIFNNDGEPTSYETITLTYDSKQTTGPNATPYAYYKSGLVEDYGTNFGSESQVSYHLRMRTKTENARYIWYWQITRVEDSATDSGYYPSDWTYWYSYDVSNSGRPPSTFSSSYIGENTPDNIAEHLRSTTLLPSGSGQSVFYSATISDDLQIDPISGDLTAAAANQGETWDDLGVTTWDNWNSWSFVSSTFTYITRNYDLGTTLTFRPIVRTNHIGTASHEVAIVPASSNETAPYQDSDFGSFFTPAGEVAAKAVKLKTTISGINATLMNLTLILDGERKEEEILGLDTSTLSATQSPSNGRFYIPLTQSFTSVQSILIVFIGSGNTGGQRTYEIVDKTTTVNGIINPEVKLYLGSTETDATVDIFVKGY